MLIQDLLKAMHDNGVEMSEEECIRMANDYGCEVYITDEEGNITGEGFWPDFQAVADMFTANFDCRPYFKKEDIFKYADNCTER